MKKIILVITSICLSVSLCACVSNTGKKAIEQGKLAMASKDYEKSINSFKLAIDEGSKDEEIQNMLQILEKYKSAENTFNSRNVVEAKTICDGIVNYENYTVKEDIEILKSNIENRLNEIELINQQIEAVKTFITNADYNSATANIADLYTKAFTNEQKSIIDEMNNTVNTKLAEIAQKQAEEAKAKAEAEAEAKRKAEEAIKIKSKDSAIEVVKANAGTRFDRYIAKDMGSYYMVSCMIDTADGEDRYKVNKKTGKLTYLGSGSDWE